MPTSCCAYGCTNHAMKEECKTRKVSFHLFPHENKKLLKLWLTKMKRVNFQPSLGTKICSDHFEEDCFVYQNFTNVRQLKKDSFPTKFVFTKPAKCRPYRPRSLEAAAADDQDEREADDPPSPQDVHRENLTQTDISFDQLITEFHLKNEEVENLKRNADARFSPVHMTENEIQALTGLIKENFFKVFEFLQLETALQPTECKLPPLKQYFLFMLKLRTAIANQFLAYIFNISKALTSRIMNRVTAITYHKVQSVNIWPEKHQVNEYMPRQFKLKFPNCRVVIDCTEIKIQRPYNPTQQQLTYSRYKSANTVKALIGIAPSGGISFISDVWCGSTSDKAMFLNSKLPDLLESGDLVLADKGFYIAKELAAKGCELATSVYLKDKIQFTLQERAQNKAVSHLRVHIERAISRIKTFQYFSGPVPFKALHNFNEVFYIAAFLSNFCHSLMNFKPQVMEVTDETDITDQTEITDET